MTDQAAGLRAWAAPDALPLGVIGYPGDDALMQALALLPAPAGRRWQALRDDQTTRTIALAWVLWVDTAQVDVADLYRRVKRVLNPVTAPATTVLLWLHDTRGAGAHLSPDPATARLIDNLSMTLKRFVNVELTRDLSHWQRCLPDVCQASVSTG